MDIKEEGGVPRDHPVAGCDTHEVCRRYNQGLVEWTERVKAENEEYRNSVKTSSTDLAVTDTLSSEN